MNCEDKTKTINEIIRISGINGSIDKIVNACLTQDLSLKEAQLLTINYVRSYFLEEVVNQVNLIFMKQGHNLADRYYE